MSKRYPGGIIRKTPQTPSQTSAQGVWDMASVTQAVKENTWPIAGVPDPVSKSLRFRSSASAYLNRTPASAGNQKTWTWSAWIKRGSFGEQMLFNQGGFSSNYTLARFNSSDNLEFHSYGTSSYNFQKVSTAVYRDPSAWYHFVFVLDATNTQARIYVNGSEVAYTTNTNPANANQPFNQALLTRIGYNTANVLPFDGYMTEIYFIDGQALTPSSFGGTNDQTGVWQPIAYTGTYGTNGFYLPFSNTASTTTLGYDYSGNSNNWTTNNISLTSGSTYDSMVDVPTQWIPYNTAGDTGALFRGNYCTLNPLNKSTVGSSTPSNGNLNVLLDRSSNNPWIQSTIAFPSSGKWYLEYSQTSINTTSTPYNMIGVMDVTTPISTEVASVTGLRGYYLWNGNKRSGTTVSSYGSGTALNDIIGVAVDMDSGKIWFAVNNTWVNSGSPTGGTNAAFTDLTGTTWSFFNSILGETTSNSWVNFGQRPFSYTPPTGFKSLNTFNLPTPTIGATASTTANKYFNAVTYAGAGAGTVITTGFYPDFAWMKNRTAAFSNFVQDSVRGGGLYLLTNEADADAAVSPSSTFSSTGITINANSSYASNSSYNFVAWAWNANSGSTVSNTQGSITSTVSANTTAGFSIVTYTGNATSSQTVGHGLGVTPTFIIIKKRSASDTWNVYSVAGGITGNTILQLNTSDAAVTGSNINITANSTTVGFGSASQVNGSGATFVAYCFAEVAGYSKFGSYTGNGSSDGPFIFTGFRPAMIWTKPSSDAGAWNVLDNKRGPYNVNQPYLQQNSSNAEATVDYVDFLSNGFKIRYNGATPNGSGQTIIYIAFAESPFKFSLAR